MSVISTMSFLVASLIGQSVVPAPVTLPSLKSGTFVCKMTDRSGKSFELRASMGNWQELRNGLGVAELEISAPAETQLSGNYSAFPNPGRGVTDLTQETGRANAGGFLATSYRPEGMLSLSTDQFGSTGHQYIGFCVTKLSTQNSELSK